MDEQLAERKRLKEEVRAHKREIEKIRANGRNKMLVPVGLLRTYSSKLKRYKELKAAAAPTKAQATEVIAEKGGGDEFLRVL